MLDRDRILTLVPHGGRMCLLDRIDCWSAEAIVCHAVSHLDPGNPLRRNGRLSAVCGIEYGLQAAAAHGALTDGAPQRAGFLVSLRGYAATVPWLDDPAFPELEVRADIPARRPDGLTVLFTVRAGGRQLLGGRASIMLPS